jgi:hypothetical protein
MLLALGIPHVKRMRHIAVGGLSGCTILFPNYLINGTSFEKENVIELKMSVSTSSMFVCNISHSMKTSAMYDEKCASVCVLITGDS